MAFSSKQIQQKLEQKSLKSEFKSEIINCLFLLYKYVIDKKAKPNDIGLDLLDRMDTLNNIIQILIKRTSFKNAIPITMLLSLNSLDFCADNGRINVPLFFLIDLELDKLPEKSDDLRSFKIECQHKNNIGIEKKLDNDWLEFKIFKQFLKNPEKIGPAFAAILLHEIGHIVYKHTSASSLEEGGHDDHISDLSLFDFLYDPHFGVLTQSKFSLKQEEEADRFIARYKDPNLINGLQHFFNSTKLKDSYAEKIVTFIAEVSGFFSHGSPSQRLKHMVEELEKYKNINVPTIKK